jgi:hypothetical protein
MMILTSQHYDIGLGRTATGEFDPRYGGCEPTSFASGYGDRAGIAGRRTGNQKFRTPEQGTPYLITKDTVPGSKFTVPGIKSKFGIFRKFNSLLVPNAFQTVLDMFLSSLHQQLVPVAKPPVF